MNTLNMARLSRCEIFLTSPLDGKALDNPLRPECYLRSRYALLPMSAGRTSFDWQERRDSNPRRSASHADVLAH